MESVLSFMRRKPTEIIFACILAVFMGPRVISVLQSALLDGEGDFDEFVIADQEQGIES